MSFLEGSVTLLFVLISSSSCYFWVVVVMNRTRTMALIGGVSAAIFSWKVRTILHKRNTASTRVTLSDTKPPKDDSEVLQYFHPNREAGTLTEATSRGLFRSYDPCNDPVKDVPQCFRHNPETYDATINTLLDNINVNDDDKCRAILQHFLAAFSGTVSNIALTETVENGHISDQLKISMKMLLGQVNENDSAQAIDQEQHLEAAGPEQQLREHLTEKLSHAAALADLCYSGFEKGLKDTELFEEHEDISEMEFRRLMNYKYDMKYSFTEYLLGRKWAVIGSDQHPNAVLLGLKLDLESKFRGDPVAETIDGLDFDVEVTLVFRGSYSPLKALCGDGAALQDWIGGNLDFRKRAADECRDLLDLKSGVSVHSGYYFRLRRLWPAITDKIDYELQRLASLGIDISKVKFRFGIAGHSQGGGIAQLAALAALKDFPESHIKLFTFSAPKVLTEDVMKDTQIRHHRFYVASDLVPRLPPGYVHTGEAYKVGGYNLFESHSVYATHLFQNYKTLKEQESNKTAATGAFNQDGYNSRNYHTFNQPGI